MNSPHQTIDFLDLYETIKQQVVENAPSVLEQIKEIESDQAWLDRSTEELRLAAVMSVMGWEYSHPGLKRKARRVMMGFLSTENSVREASPSDEIKLTPNVQKQLRENLSNVNETFVQKTLSNSSGFLSAIKSVEKSFPFLRGMRSYDWLASIGYPVVVPDQAKMRFQHRLGLADVRKANAENRILAARELEALARQCGVSVAEFNLILSVFTGTGSEETRPAAVCLRAPKCPECGVRDRCVFYRYSRKEVQKEQRSLSATTRKEDRPRERLERSGAGSLSDEDLIAILLRTGSGKLNAIDLSKAIMRDAQTLDRLASMSVNELSKYNGLGRVKAITLKAAFELARRIQQEPGNQIRPRLDHSRVIFNYLRPRFSNSRREEFLALHLNTKMELIREVQISVGTLNQSLVHPREVFVEAIRDSAYAIIFAHNHPSGDPKPSRDDERVTKKLVEAGDILGIKVLDHIVIGHTDYYSFADHDKC